MRVLVSSTKTLPAVGSITTRPTGGEPYSTLVRKPDRFANIGDARGRSIREAGSGDHYDPANQVNFGACHGAFLEPAPRSSRTQPPDVVVGSPPIATRG
ncbi:MAG: hypothetical protein QOJ59_2491 [Thermomicrobiales bacterium]|jgi:hypothetical protein|nr:hypothetical protein [Thermomicrobiales bacterium]